MCSETITKRRLLMASVVQLSDKIVDSAKKSSKIFSRSIAKQVEHWARVGKIAEENPDLTYESIKEILFSLSAEEQNSKKG